MLALGILCTHASPAWTRTQRRAASAGVLVIGSGGRYLVRGGAMQPLEGEWRSRAVLVEFPTYAAALAFYDSDAYQKARQVRLRSSTASVVAMDGISDI